jgi:hypothetical protein
MTRFELCTALGEILPRGIVRSLYHAGLLNTKRRGNRDVSINSYEVRRQLRITLERIQCESAKTIERIEAGLELMQTPNRKYEAEVENHKREQEAYGNLAAITADCEDVLEEIIAGNIPHILFCKV